MTGSECAKYLMDLGMLLEHLSMQQSEWSQKTFGTDAERGPVSALKHLEKEAKEAYENPTDEMELADCFLLILDAARRAGITPKGLLMISLEKLDINKKINWPKPVGDEPVFHVKDASDE